MAVISSRLDYCNSLLNNIVKRDLAKLQRIHFLLIICLLNNPKYMIRMKPSTHPRTEKAPSKNGISGEHLKYGGRSLQESMHNLIYIVTGVPN